MYRIYYTLYIYIVHREKSKTISSKNEEPIYGSMKLSTSGQREQALENRNTPTQKHIENAGPQSGLINQNAKVMLHELILKNAI